MAWIRPTLTRLVRTDQDFVTAAARNWVRWSIKGVGLWTGSVWCKAGYYGTATRGHAIRSNTYKVLYRGNKRSVIGDDGARNKASSKERVSNLCIEHGGWMPRSSVCICSSCATLVV
ncbi:hypothetical protein ACSQ67_011606 [Phaseolus vulgaris]